MGLFGGKKHKNKKGYDYRMLFNAVKNDERDQQIKSYVVKCLRDAGVMVDNVKTTLNGDYGSTAEYTGQPGESITIECASTPMMEDSSSYIAINVKSNICSEESIQKAFQEIKMTLWDRGYSFTEF